MPFFDPIPTLDQICDQIKQRCIRARDMEIHPLFSPPTKSYYSEGDTKNLMYMPCNVYNNIHLLDLAHDNNSLKNLNDLQILAQRHWDQEQQNTDPENELRKCY